MNYQHAKRRSQDSVWPLRRASGEPWHAIADRNPHGRRRAAGSVAEGDRAAVAKPIAQTLPGDSAA